MKLFIVTDITYNFILKGAKKMTYQKLDEKLIREWNWEKNVGLDPRKLNVKAKTKLWWICANGHEWSARLDHRKRGSGCP